jgi:hypothetical protein
MPLSVPPLSVRGTDSPSEWGPIGAQDYELPRRSGPAAQELGDLPPTSTDLKTESTGPACDFNMRNFLGTDGSVFVFEVTNRSAGTLAKARDRNTCEALWTLPAQVDSLARIWRINATLVQLSNDGTELMSLVPPS